MPSRSADTMKAISIRCLALLVFALSAGSLPAQIPGKAAGKPSATIALTVVATDGAGQPVSGLTRQDFRVEDNRTPTTILDFKAMPAPSGGAPAEQILFVIDEINTDFTDVSRARSELIHFLRRDNGKLALPATILILDDKGARFSGEPSLDGNLIANEFDRASQGLRTIRRSAAFYGAVERLTLSLRALTSLTRYESTRPGRKLVVWLSAGWPYLASPGANYSAKDQQNNFATVVDLSNSLRTSGITLYNVDPRGTSGALGFQATYYQGYLKGVRKASDTTLSNLGLQVLASQSGGLVLNSSNAIENEIAQCAADARSYYVLTIPAADAEGAVRYHALNVQVAKPGLTARTSTGYYTAPR